MVGAVRNGVLRPSEPRSRTTDGFTELALAGPDATRGGRCCMAVEEEATAVELSGSPADTFRGPVEAVGLTAWLIGVAG